VALDDAVEEIVARIGEAFGVVDPLLVVADPHRSLEHAHHRHHSKDGLRTVIRRRIGNELADDAFGVLTSPRDGPINPSQARRDVQPLGAGQARCAGKINLYQVELGALRIRRIPQPLQGQHEYGPSVDGRVIDEGHILSASRGAGQSDGC
jgi:hypothetical protein